VNARCRIHNKMTDRNGLQHFPHGLSKQRKERRARR
jgi:hypothetical protein